MVGSPRKCKTYIEIGRLGPMRCMKKYEAACRTENHPHQKKNWSDDNPEGPMLIGPKTDERMWVFWGLGGAERPFVPQGM